MSDGRAGLIHEVDVHAIGNVASSSPPHGLDFDTAKEVAVRLARGLEERQLEVAIAALEANTFH